jgi:hypothetical protein
VGWLERTGERVGPAGWGAASEPRRTSRLKVPLLKAVELEPSNREKDRVAIPRDNHDRLRSWLAHLLDATSANLGAEAGRWVAHYVRSAEQQVPSERLGERARREDHPCAIVHLRRARHAGLAILEGRLVHRFEEQRDRGGRPFGSRERDRRALSVGVRRDPRAARRDGVLKSGASLRHSTRTRDRSTTSSTSNAPHRAKRASQHRTSTVRRSNTSPESATGAAALPDARVGLDASTDR